MTAVMKTPIETFTDLLRRFTVPKCAVFYFSFLKRLGLSLKLSTVVVIVTSKSKTDLTLQRIY